MQTVKNLNFDATYMLFIMWVTNADDHAAEFKGMCFSSFIEL